VQENPDPNYGKLTTGRQIGLGKTKTTRFSARRFTRKFG
jgi:hypothetical protein